MTYIDAARRPIRRVGLQSLEEFLAGAFMGSGLEQLVARFVKS